MNKMLTFILFSLLIFSSVIAIPSEIVYEEVIPGAENFTDIDPILDENNQLEGFVFTDDINHLVKISLLESDSVVNIEIPSGAIETLVHHIPQSDSLMIFVLTISGMNRPIISKIIIYNSTISTTPYTVRTYSGSWGTPATFGEKVNLKFSFDRDSENNKIVKFESSFKIHEIIPTIGYEDYTLCTTILYDLSIEDELFRDNVSHIALGNLYSSLNQDTVTCLDYYYFLMDYDNPNSREISYSHLQVTDELGNLMHESLADFAQFFDIKIFNFKPSSSEDELIVYANDDDFSNSSPIETHLACYSFTDKSPFLIWYNNEIGDLALMHIYNQKDLLVGYRNNHVIFINYLNGQLTDSTDILFSPENLTFFETEPYNKRLHALYQSYDTVFVRLFDLITGITEQYEQPEIPSTFTLFQNHPNPFNGDTRLEFYNEQIQHLSLKIYNILGQEIKSIAERQFSPGQYTFYWDGKNEEGLPQSTGVYFARLESTLETGMIKLIYLK